MIDILLAGTRLAANPAFKAALDRRDTKSNYMESGFKVLAAVAKQRFDLLIADEVLDDMTGLELISSIILVQPLLNCAAVSSLSPGEFHEATEGLGILMQLPMEPGKREADRLLDHLKTINALG